MPFTREEIDDIATECFAADVAYDFDRLCNMSEDDIREYFEDGGDVVVASDEPAWSVALHKTHAELASRLRALADGVDGAPPLAPAELAACVHALNLQPSAAGLRSLLLNAVLRSMTIADASSLEAHYATLEASALSSAPDVRVVHGPLGELATSRGPGATALDGSTGVLLLGFGGSSLASLEAYEAMYERHMPMMSRITHAGPLQTIDDEVWGGGRANEMAPTTAAIDELMAAVREVEKLVLHCQSNQGHAIWVHMLKREPSLGAKVSTIFYDCAASPEDFFTAEMGPEISIKSVMATLGGFKVVPPPNVMPLIQQGAKAHHKAMGVERSLRTLAVCPAAFEWLAAHEPPVPATCVTSPEDTVIKMDGVQTFASMLRKAQPSRKVKVEVLRGQHVQVMRTSTAQYEEALRELIASADIGGTWIE